MHEQPGRGDAALARIGQHAGHRRRQHGRQVGAFQHQVGRLAAQFLVDALDRRRRGLRHRDARAGRSGEAHHVDVLVRRQRRADARPVAIDQVEYAGRHACRVEVLGEDRGAGRRFLGRLEDHRVARRQRRRDLGADLVERPVPRRDHRHHAERLVHHPRLADALLEGEVLQRLQRADEVAEPGRSLRRHGQPDRRAHLLAHRRGEVRDARLIALDAAFEQCDAVRDARLRPAVERLARGGDSLDDIGLTAERDLGAGLLGARIDHLVALAALARDPLAIDIVLEVAAHPESPTGLFWNARYVGIGGDRLQPETRLPYGRMKEIDMARVARIERTGGPEVIQWDDVDLPPPGAGEVRMRNTAVGLNFIDTYHRSGLYPIALPGGLGSEAAGVIEAVGEGVSGFAVGERVGTFGPARGADASERNLPANQLFKLPDAVDDRPAAALLLKGCTVEMLVERCARVEAGQVALVHAAAGGVGHLLVGWLKAVGATVIGTVGDQAKGEQAKRAGADHVLLHKGVDVAAKARESTDGKGVAVSLDGVGTATWPVTLASVARPGLIVSSGNARGPVEGVSHGIQSQKGSLFVTRPTLFDYYVTPEERQAGIERLFAMLANGAISPEIGQTFALEDAADAHRALEAGKTQGSTVLLP